MSDLFLSDDPPPRRNRPRWVDALGLTALVIGMIAIGVLGDRGSKDATSVPTTTTTTRSRTPTTRSAEVGPNPSSQTTTTQAVPTVIAKRLQEETDTSLVLLADEQPPRLLEVDTGIVRPLLMPTGYAVTGTSAGFLIAAPKRLWLVRISELEVGATYATSEGEHLLVPAGLKHAWFTTPSAVRQVAAELGPDGAETGRTITLPGQTQVVAGLDDGVVASQAGSLTYVPAEGEPRGVGSGQVLGGGGDSIVRTSCEALHCRVDLVDVRTGRSRSVTGVPEPQPTLDGGGLVSADGRWFAATLYDAADGIPTLVSIDLTTGHGRILNRGSARPKAFAVTGRTLFAIDRGRLLAFDAATGSNREFTDLDASNVSRLAATVGP
ncbi:MAG: hypothetical protein JWN29_1772 [Acidimicrobiales bacterium]|nr:hypothetical protein [Acidimicrobiales bacterium]